MDGKAVQRGCEPLRRTRRSEKGFGHMNRYTYSDDARAALEGLQQPLAVYQLIDDRIVTLLVSDGFCKLLGYADRERAV